MSDVLGHTRLPDWAGLKCRCGTPDRKSAQHRGRVDAIATWLDTLHVWKDKRPPNLVNWVNPWASEWEVGRNREPFADKLAQNQSVMQAISGCPLALADALSAFLDDHLRRLPSNPARGVALWAVTTALLDAAWQAIALDGPGAEVRVEQTPGIAQARFYLMTAPQRSVDNKQFLEPPSETNHPNNAADTMFGDAARFGIVLRDARAVWASILNSHQSYPVLGLSGADLEREVDRLVFADDECTRLLATGDGPAHEPLACPADETHLVQAVEQHLLPRFRVGRVWRLDRRHRPRGLAGRLLRWAPLPVLGLSVVAILLAVACPGLQFWFRYASIAFASVALLLAGADSMSASPVASMKWLWRLPAASVVGVLILIALSRTWWEGLVQGGAGVPFAAGAALVASSYGYLLLEARNHGVAWNQAWRRTLGVLGFAAAHSYLVVTIGLNLVGSVFMDGAIQLVPSDPPPLSELLDDPSRYLPLVALATAWCIAAGVFSQILWDDRPITAPLAHMHWTKGG